MKSPLDFFDFEDDNNEVSEIEKAVNQEEQEETNIEEEEEEELPSINPPKKRRRSSHLELSKEKIKRMKKEIIETAPEEQAEELKRIDDEIQKILLLKESLTGKKSPSQTQNKKLRKKIKKETIKEKERKLKVTTAIQENDKKIREKEKKRPQNPFDGDESEEEQSQPKTLKEIILDIPKGLKVPKDDQQLKSNGVFSMRERQLLVEVNTFLIT